MGSDLSVVNSARVSFGKKSNWDNADRLLEYPDIQPILSEGDTRLINFLAKHEHYSPFNHTFITLHVKAPIFVARQLQKHEYMPWNEISRRYVDTDFEFYEPEEWRERSEDKKQGSGGRASSQYFPNNYINDIHKDSLEKYNKMLVQGIAPEQARIILPQTMYTEWYWSGTLKAWAKMYNLRSKEDAQWETRQVALQAGELITLQGGCSMGD